MTRKSFYLKRAAWGLVTVSVAALPLHAFISRHASGYVAELAVSLFVAALFLGLLQPKENRNRWLPAELTFLAYIVHAIFPCA